MRKSAQNKVQKYIKREENILSNGGNVYWGGFQILLPILYTYYINRPEITNRHVFSSQHTHTRNSKSFVIWWMLEATNLRTYSTNKPRTSHQTIMNNKKNMYAFLLFIFFLSLNFSLHRKNICCPHFKISILDSSAVVHLFKRIHIKLPAIYWKFAECSEVTSPSTATHRHFHSIE